MYYKVSYKDGVYDKLAIGELTNEDDQFITIKGTRNGRTYKINKKYVVSMVEVFEWVREMRLNYWNKTSEV